MEAGLHRRRILSFLRSNLSDFSNDYKTSVTSLNQSNEIKLENDISKELSFFLNNMIEDSGYVFGFQAVGPDILVRQYRAKMHSDALFFIEAKRLPPTSDKDYVTTGIGRFKEEKHGKRHDVAAMLGYVQEDDFNHWHGKVNSWIEDLIPATDKELKWENQDKLKKVKVTEIGEYSSKHSRISKGPITLHHFWINLHTFS